MNIATLALIVLHVNIAQVTGPQCMSNDNIRTVLRAVKRQYRKQARVVLFWDSYGVVGEQSFSYEPTVESLRDAFADYSSYLSPVLSGKGRPVVVFSPPLKSPGSDTLYAGGIATLGCAKKKKTFGLVSVGDTSRQWELSPTTVGHELAHQLSATHESEGMLSPAALSLVTGPRLKDRPRISLSSLRKIRSCLQEK